MEQITVQQFESLGNSQAIRGNVLIKDYDGKEQKDGKVAVQGTLSTQTGGIQFKIWPGEIAKHLLENDIRGSVVGLIGTINVWQDTKKIIIEDLSVLEGEDVTDYQQKKYNADEIFSVFRHIMAKNLSDEGKEVFNLLLVPHLDKFKKEQAALGHHDAVLNGLLAHSTKCLTTLHSVIGNYPAILERCDKDLLYIGTGLHDLGKVIEYNNGAISSVGKLLSHRTLAVVELQKIADQVVKLKSEDFVNRLMGIFEQHHGDYEETPRTFEAMVVHSIDNMESSMTDLNELAEKHKPYEQAFHYGKRLS